MSYFDEVHPTVLAEPVGPGDHVRGPASAEVTLVEYGDFACPSCRGAYPIVKELLGRSADLRFVFRANPRSHLFPAAEPAAEAAEAAAVQGKFWEMHDGLFESEVVLSRARLVALAGALNLDVARFERELGAGTHRSVVRAQEVSGWHSHVLSTPTFFINGIRHDDAPDLLPAAVERARRLAKPRHHVFREARVQSTDGRRRQRVTVGPHEILADLPPEDGGGDAGPGPHDLLLAAIGACTAMTVQWSAEKHQVRLRHVDVRSSQSITPEGRVIRLSVTIDGDLDEAQLGLLQHAAEACPIAKTLARGLTLETRVTVGLPGADSPTPAR